MKITSLRVYLLSLLSIATIAAVQGQAVKPNIIFIVVDDLNDYTSDLEGLPAVETPNISRISANGTVFTNAVCSSPLCCPSRTSFLTGKAAEYTGVYSSSDYRCNDFSKNFTPANGNDTYFTIPGYLKDYGNYFTYGINKIFHCYENYQEYDSTTIDPCAKGLSWNKIFVHLDTNEIIPGVNMIDEGVHNNEWSRINDTLEPYMMDYIAVDSSIKFINEFANGEGTCGNPFFLALGIKKPHKPNYIPEKYYLPEYVEDFYATPFDIPFNFPPNAYPLNGIIMPPQPEVPFSDLYSLPDGGMGQSMIKGADENFVEWGEALSPVPEVHPDFSDSLSLDILTWSMRANSIISYIAAVKYIDAQIGRLLDSLESYPEVYNNSVIILVSDNGYSLSEKRHWGKRDLWETDVRIPLIISDLRNPIPQVSKSMVTLLDLFPTICTLADVPQPTFPDGTSYLDGNDITNLMQDPDLLIEIPQLSSVRKEADTEGFCNPQYSIRDDRFHYIRYKSNGGGESICDSAGSYIEEELYEIGIDRTVDPNEWNNLIANSNYLPVVEYISQWMPGGAMYLQKAFLPIINNNEIDCILDYNDTILLSTDIFDTLGVLVSPPAEYIYAWTNNLNTDTIFGTSATFAVGSLSPEVYELNDEIFFYFTIIEPITKRKIGFDLKVYYLNPINEPFATFTLLVDDEYTINVFDFEITGDYTDYWWTIDGDSLHYNVKPGPHSFGVSGSYTYVCNVRYGNDDCIATFEETNKTTIENYFENESLIAIPNPANNNVILLLKSLALNGELYIYGSTGNLVKHLSINNNYNNYYEIDNLELQSGIYMVVNINDETKIATPLVICRN